MMIDQRARPIIGLLDLTSLEDSDDEAKIAGLCRRAVTPHGKVAAVCVYGRFVPQCRAALSGTGIRVAAVVNFPHGGTDAEAAAEEAAGLVALGADEIDMVLPYDAFLHGETAVARAVVVACRGACGDRAKLKVILETGALAEPARIVEASRLAIAAGADFIKTSTGKGPPGATPAAARAMLTVIRETARPVGFKASGGVRTLEQALDYVSLAEEIMGAGWCTPANFRIGASGLLDDLLRHLGDGPAKSGAATY